jgi:FkbM family methyltransferase
MVKQMVQAAGVISRSIHRLFDREYRGEYRLVKLLSRVFPAYKGEFRLNDGVEKRVNTGRSGLEEWLFFTGTHQHKLTGFLRRQVQMGQYCMDVGAHLGFYTLKFANWVGSQGRVAAFEPNVATYGELLENITRNGLTNIDVVNKALSNKPGTAPFYITTPGMSSLHVSRNRGVGSVEVVITTIDDYFEQSGWPRLDLIKIDTEGYDCHAVVGAQKTIAKYRPLIALEYSLICDTMMCQAALELMNACGYSYMNIDSDKMATNLTIDKLNEWLPHLQEHMDLVCIPPSKT